MFVYARVMAAAAVIGLPLSSPTTLTTAGDRRADAATKKTAPRQPQVARTPRDGEIAVELIRTGGMSADFGVVLSSDGSVFSFQPSGPADGNCRLPALTPSAAIALPSHCVAARMALRPRKVAHVDEERVERVAAAVVYALDAPCVKRGLELPPEMAMTFVTVFRWSVDGKSWIARRVYEYTSAGQVACGDVQEFLALLSFYVSPGLDPAPRERP